MIVSLCLLRIGAWSLEIRSERPFDAAVIAFLQKRNVFPWRQSCAAPVRLTILRHCESDLEGQNWLLRGEQTNRVELLLSHSTTRCVHVLMGALDWALHKIFFAHRLLVLHASAVEFKGRVSLFLGPRGFGKTTVALALGFSGATVLADDRVALHNGSKVSGCYASAKVTEETERHFFQGNLSVAARDYQGLRKKEIALENYFEIRPYVDFSPWRLCFLSRGDRFTCGPLSRAQALLSLIDETRPLWKFASPAEMRILHANLALLVEGTEPVALQLSGDLNDLQRLVEGWEGCPAN